VSAAVARRAFRVSWPIVFGLLGMLGVGLSRIAIVPRFMALREKSDMYALPSPEQVVVASLGYRSALADLIFAHVLVWHGLHFEQKRRFEFAADYLDTVSTLDPTFRETYYFGDTLISMQPIPPRREDYVRARALLEKGLAARPFDTELWLSTGQYIAYVAAPWLEDPKEQSEWKLAGARILARACELVGSNENIPFNCIGAAGLLSKAGEREATIQFLERVLSVSDDEEIRAFALAYLERALGERARAQVRARADRLRKAWKSDLPFVGLTTELILGPPGDPAACAGRERKSVACAATWASWRERVSLEEAPVEEDVNPAAAPP
jgi:tetratricopeptide (TPR) repeat protein